MTEDRLFKWLDLLSKLLIPVVIAVGTAVFTYRQAHIADAQLAAQRESDNERRDLERDSNYVKMLASQNPDEKKLGLEIIRVLSGEKKFSKDLIPVLTVYASGQPNDPLTQIAGGILSKAGRQDSNIHQEIASAAANAPVQVYVQISKEEQRQDALLLQTELRKKGFASPAIQLVGGSTATVKNYIRYFSAPSAREANVVKATMSSLGYAFVGYDGTQDFSAYTQTPLASLEVWVGKNQGPLPATTH